MNTRTGRYALVLQVGRRTALVLHEDGQARRVLLKGRSLQPGQRIWVWDQAAPTPCRQGARWVWGAMAAAGGAAILYQSRWHGARPHCATEIPLVPAGKPPRLL